MDKIWIHDWKQRKLGDVFKEYSEKNHAEQPVLTIMQGEGTRKREDSERNLVYNKSNLSSYKMVYQDDFIVHLRSFEGGLEKASCNGIVSPAYHIFHGEKADSRFYYSYFRSYEFIKRKLVPHIYGIRDGRSIDIAGMKTIDIPYPSFEEQQRIGDYLDSVNNLITFHQRELNILNKICRYAWEQRKLGDISEKVCVGFVGTCEKYYTDETGIPMYRTGNLNGLSLNKDDMKYVTRDFHQQNKKSQLKFGDILIARHGDSGKAVNYESSEEANCLNIVIISPDFKKCNYRFLTDCINSPRCQKNIKSLSAGSTQAVINTSEIEKLDVLLPESIDEQETIATYFDAIDHLITLHQRKCNQLQIIRKYMIKNMFL